MIRVIESLHEAGGQASPYTSFGHWSLRQPTLADCGKWIDSRVVQRTNVIRATGTSVRSPLQPMDCFPGLAPDDGASTAARLRVTTVSRTAKFHPAARVATSQGLRAG